MWLVAVPRILAPSGRYVWNRLDFPPGTDVIQYDREELSARCGAYHTTTRLEPAQARRIALRRDARRLHRARTRDPVRRAAWAKTALVLPAPLIPTLDATAEVVNVVIYADGAAVVDYRHGLYLAAVIATLADVGAVFPHRQEALPHV